MTREQMPRWQEWRLRERSWRASYLRWLWRGLWLWRGRGLMGNRCCFLNENELQVFGCLSSRHSSQSQHHQRVMADGKDPITIRSSRYDMVHIFEIDRNRSTSFTVPSLYLGTYLPRYPGFTPPPRPRQSSIRGRDLLSRLKRKHPKRHILIWNGDTTLFRTRIVNNALSQAGYYLIDNKQMYNMWRQRIKALRDTTLMANELLPHE